MDTSALERLVAEADDRPSLWAAFLAAVEARQVAEIGVYKGLFAEYLLDRCPGITTYYMVDPWRHLEEWNKPANKSDDQFEQIYAEAMRRTEQHAERRVVLRGRTTEVIGKVPDGSLDFAYVDGDHTLRGITLDLQTVFGKVRDGGWVGGDDFCRSIWQHSEAFEPTMVFPYAVHFAEAVGARIYALPFRQFLIEKQRDGAFEFVDLTATYGTTELLSQVRPPVSSRAAAKRAAQVPPAVREGAGRARKIARRASRKVLREVRARTRG